jgi:hypothetical protein
MRTSQEKLSINSSRIFVECAEMLEIQIFVERSRSTTTLVIPVHPGILLVLRGSYTQKKPILT